MQAKIRQTGEIIEVAYCGTLFNMHSEGDVVYKEVGDDESLYLANDLIFI